MPDQSFPHAGIAAAEVSDTEIEISYLGMYGGGKLAGSTMYLRRMERVIICIDDTNTPEV